MLHHYQDDLLIILKLHELNKQINKQADEGTIKQMNMK